MINAIDVILAVLILVQLVKSLGGPAKIIKGIIFILIWLMAFGIIIRLLMGAPLPEPSRKMLNESYFVKISYAMIKWAYPAVENNAPKVNQFIKDKIISSPTPEVSLPKVVIPKEVLPDITIPEIK